MPVYEYRCKDCGRKHDIEQGFFDERPSKCPNCGGHLVRVFHPVGLVFKGSGFYRTDSRAGPTPPPASESKPAEAKTSESKPPESKPADTKSQGKPADPKKP